jgi:hypothetical protein
MDRDEPHLASNEKTQPIQWTEWSTCALVVIGSLWPHNDNIKWCSRKPISSFKKLNELRGVMHF